MFEHPNFNETVARVNEFSICHNPRRTEAVHRASPAKVTHPEVSAEVGYLLQQMNLARHFTPDWQSLRTGKCRTSFSTYVSVEFPQATNGHRGGLLPHGAMR